MSPVSAVNDLFERAVMGLVGHVPGLVVGLIAFLLYPCFGLVLPLALHWSLLELVEANVLGVAFAAVVALGWLSLQIEAGKRRHLVAWTTNLRLLNGEEFEWLVGEMFNREGWKVRYTGHQDAADGNIDLELKRGEQRKIVQCKRWSAWLISVDEIREFGGTLLREKLPGSAGIFVTLSDFTEPARTEAKQSGIALLDGRDLHSRIEKVRRAEPCPICHQPMRFDRSAHGWWFRCVTPGCLGKKDLGSEPGRAVEFLTEPPLSVTRAN
jgi:HJR/Mrr/RecB family endonuclease